MLSHQPYPIPSIDLSIPWPPNPHNQALHATPRTNRRPRRRFNLYRGTRTLHPVRPNQHRNNRASHQRKAPMPHHRQHTRNRPRMRRQRNNRARIMRKHIEQELAEPDIARRVRLAQLGVIQRIFLREVFLEPVQRVFLRDSRLTRPAVAGVEADCFAKKLVRSLISQSINQSINLILAWNVVYIISYPARLLCQSSSKD